MLFPRLILSPGSTVQYNGLPGAVQDNFRGTDIRIKIEDEEVVLLFHIHDYFAVSGFDHASVGQHQRGAEACFRADLNCAAFSVDGNRNRFAQNIATRNYLLVTQHIVVIF